MLIPHVTDHISKEKSADSPRKIFRSLVLSEMLGLLNAIIMQPKRRQDWSH